MTVAERIERIEKECSNCYGLSGITSWERERLVEWKDRDTLSPKQEAILQQIERKAFGGED